MITLNRHDPNRDPHDRYYTPPELTRGLLEVLDEIGLDFPGPILEPCAGDGGISDVLRWAGHEVIEGDILPAPKRAGRYTWDFLDEAYSSDPPACFDRFGSIITNPPYKTRTATAAAFVQAALHISPRVAMLLRSSFLEEWSDRARLLIEQPPGLVIICPRVSFGGPGGSDGKAFAATWWFVWHPKLTGYPIIARLTQRDMTRLRGQQELL